jgi:hypothetical protein
MPPTVLRRRLRVKAGQSSKSRRRALLAMSEEIPA